MNAVEYLKNLDENFDGTHVNWNTKCRISKLTSYLFYLLF